MRKPTIYEIAERTKKSSPLFFSADTMRFFNQEMSSFKVHNQSPDGRFKITAPMKDWKGEVVGETVRFFNPLTNELETK